MQNKALIYHESVGLNQSEINSALKKAKAITRHYAKSFYFAAQFLPREKRLASYALYGFCRVTDNLVDRADISDNEKRFQLRLWRSKTIDAFLEESVCDPILIAFKQMVETYQIDERHALMLIDGVEMDLNQNRYQSYEELQVFCYKVASVVGLMMSEIMGYSNKAALSYAVKLGEAMQLTNILRDINEDYVEHNRIYLPKQDLDKFGVSEEDIKMKRITEGFKSLMKYYIAKARALYQEADIGINMLSKDSAFSIKAASRIYSQILNEIEKQNYDIYQKRASYPMSKKILTVIKEYIKK